MPGSGKGEVCSVAIGMGIPLYSMGDLVRELFAHLHPGRVMAEIGDFANEERSIHGPDIWARRLAERVDSDSTQGLIVIDGVRSRYETDLFRERWEDDFKVLAVHSSPGTRYARLMERMRGDDPSQRADFDRRDLRELGWGIGDVISTADIMVLNEGTASDLRSKARDILHILGCSR